MTCAALEVSRTGADQDFVLADHALAASPAYTTVRVHHDRTCIHEDVDQSFFQSLSVNSLTCRNNKESYFFRYFLSFDNLCSYTEIFDTSVVAGT